MAEPPHAFFVYGSLKRGQPRHGMLAPFARLIEDGRIRGDMHDLGEYPAVVEGNGVVHGEVIHVSEEDMPRALAVLDAFEGFQDAAEDQSLYLRRLVEVTMPDGHSEPAFVYLCNEALFGKPGVRAAPRIETGIWE